MNQNRAAKLLEHPDGPVTAETIRAAFTARVMALHPDTAKTHGAGKPVDIDELKEARDTLLNRCNVGEFACKTCKGSGTVRYRIGTRRCMACRGTGETHGS